MMTTTTTTATTRMVEVVVEDLEVLTVDPSLFGIGGEEVRVDLE